jgi:hypothetical protein
MPILVMCAARRAAAFAALSVLFLIVALGAAPSVHANAPHYSPIETPLIAIDWQDPLSLPRRFRNHCGFDAFHQHYYCANHCGRDYAFYYCSRESFGCCRSGLGYCGWDGVLRCAP